MIEGANKATLANREKYWEERTPEEKIEVLRNELAVACRFIQTQQQTIAKLTNHQHAADGCIVVPMYSQQMMAQESSGPGLFTSDSGIPRSLRLERDRR